MVGLRELRLADELGGKAYCLFQGVLAEVEAAVEVAVEGLARPDLLVGQVIIPQLHEEMAANLASTSEFLGRLRVHGRKV